MSGTPRRLTAPLLRRAAQLAAARSNQILVGDSSRNLPLSGSVTVPTTITNAVVR